jgi:GT2 family glycosyltransferase
MPDAVDNLQQGVPRPDVTIVVVAFDVRRQLERCLASIATHAGVQTETVLVDNASTDGTAEWVHENHSDVEVIELRENIGVAARQHGLERAHGRYTMFLDSDAALTPGALPSMVSALDDHAGWGLIGPRLVYDDGTLQLSCRRFPPRLLPLLRRPPLARWFEDRDVVQKHLMTDFDHEHARPVFYVLGACQLFRTPLARAAGRVDAHIFFGPDDIDWCIRIRDAGGEVVYFPQATVVHSYRRMTSSAPVSAAALRHLRAFAYFQWKYRHRRREFLDLENALDGRVGS